MNRKVQRTMAIAVLAIAALTPTSAAYAATEPSHRITTVSAVNVVARSNVSTIASSRYTIRAGDSLSGIAARRCGKAAAWPAIYATNRRVIGSNPNLIYPGQRLTLSCTGSTKPAASIPTVRSSGAWANPLPGAVVTSCYGMRWGRMHQGTDLARAAGTPIRAAHAGTVKVAGWRFGGYGISIVLSHGGGTYTHYAHISRTAVRVGQNVRVGQTIGYVGSTGDSTGPHLHFEIWRGWFAQVAPTPFMRARGVRVGC